jgi:alpha-tubulin suppressor-like RCC1 family protein
MLTNIKAIKAGSYFGLMLTNGGDVWGWGWNHWGQLGDGSSEDRREPVKALSRVREIAVGFHHSLALTETDELWAFGKNFHGQLGNGTNNNQRRAVRIMKGVQHIAAGFEHSLALTLKGEVMAWGLNDRGQLGIEGWQSASHPVLVTGVPDQVQRIPFAAGGALALGFTDLADVCRATAPRGLRL